MKRTFNKAARQIIELREHLNLGLMRLGFVIPPSAANFVFARHPGHEGAALAAALRDHAVLVRHFAKPRISDYLRVTVGTEAWIEKLLAVLSRVV